MTTKILVTGASGFIGSHTAIDLLNHGYHVRGTIRNLKNAARLKRMLAGHTQHIDNLELVAATLTDSASWEGATQSCNGIFHLASPVPIEQPSNADELIIPAKVGVLNVLKAAEKSGIKRVIVTSSVAAVSANPRAGVSTQTAKDWSDPNFPSINAYGLSKTLAEKAAWEFVSEKNIDLVTVNPAMVLGPALEPDYGTSLEVLALLMSGRYPFLPKLSMGIVDVRDVATLHRLAFEKGNPGERLLCSHSHLSLLEISALLRTEFPLFRRKLPKRELPSFLFRLLGRFNPVVATIVPDLDKTVTYDCEPAKNLGWQPRSIEEAIISGANSLIEQGVLQPN